MSVMLNITFLNNKMSFRYHSSWFLVSTDARILVRDARSLRGQRSNGICCTCVLVIGCNRVALSGQTKRIRSNGSNLRH